MADSIIIGASIIAAALILAPCRAVVRPGFQPKASSGGLGAPPTGGSAVRKPLRFGAMGEFLGPFPPERDCRLADPQQ